VNGELASHTHRARASVGELDDGPGTRNRRNGGVGRRAAEIEHVPTQSAASSVAATPPPAFLRCRLSGTLDDSAPLGIIQERDFGGFRGRFHRRPRSPDAGDRFRFPTAAQTTNCFAIPGELAGREWFATAPLMSVRDFFNGEQRWERCTTASGQVQSPAAVAVSVANQQPDALQKQQRRTWRQASRFDSRIIPAMQSSARPRPDG
jgi:hypothetical protein